MFIAETAKVGGDAVVAGYAVVSSPADLFHGVGYYAWTAFPDSKQGLVLRYGCERRPLADWPGLIRDLCKEHDSRPEVDRELRAVIAACRLRWRV